MGETKRPSVVNEWVRLVRWARLGASVTAVALDLATYADPDGTSVFPGTARIALDCEVCYRTVKYALAKLRRLRLIEPVRRRPGSLITEYRLRLPPLDELRECVTVPWPDEYQMMIDWMNKANRRARKPRKTYRQPDACTSEGTGNGVHHVRATSDGVPTKDPPAIDPPSGERPSVEPVQDRYSRARETDDALTRRVWTRDETEEERSRQADALTEWIKKQRKGGEQPDVA